MTPERRDRIVLDQLRRVYRFEVAALDASHLVPIVIGFRVTPGKLPEVIEALASLMGSPVTTGEKVAGA